VKEVSPGHFHWPELDIDLTQEIIEHPERFPLSDKSTWQCVYTCCRSSSRARSL